MTPIKKVPDWPEPLFCLSHDDQEDAADAADGADAAARLNNGTVLLSCLTIPLRESSTSVSVSPSFIASSIASQPLLAADQSRGSFFVESML
jgi:hypothetical protein